MSAIEGLTVSRPDDEDDGRDYGGDISKYFGLVDDYEFRFFPGSTYQGPFLALLTYHPETAVPFIVRYVEQASETYANNRLDGEIAQTKLRLSKGDVRAVRGSARLWCMYRGTQANPYILESALRALEHWVLNSLANGSDVSGPLRYILENSKTVSSLAVVASVATAYPNIVGELALPLLGSLDFFHFDHARAMLDQQESTEAGSFWGLAPRGVDHVFYDERKQSAAKPHRQMHLESLAVQLQSGSLKGAMQDLIDVIKVEDELEEDDVEARMILKRIDLRDYQILKKTDDGFVIAPNVVEPDLKKAVQEAQESLLQMSRTLGLANWAAATWKGEGDARARFSDWRHALQEAQTLEVEPDSSGKEEDQVIGYSALQIGAYVAAYLVRDHRQELSADQVSWCKARVEEAISRDHDTTDRSKRIGSNSLHGSRPAAAVLPLFFDLSEVDRAWIRQQIANALSHASEEVQKFAMAGVREWLWPRDTALARRCFAFFMKFAADRETALQEYRKTRWDAPDKPSFEARSAALIEHLRLALTSTGSESGDLASGDFNVSDLLDDDFITALQLLPKNSFSAPYLNVFTNGLNALIADEVVRREGERDKAVELSTEFRHEFPNLFAHFLLYSDVPLTVDAEPLLTLRQAVSDAPEITALVLEKLFYEVERSGKHGRFWVVWRICGPLAFSSPSLRTSDRVIGHSEARKLIRVLLFANINWKQSDNWKPLDENLDFIRVAVDSVGGTSAGFGALIPTLRTIAKTLLPDILVKLESQSRSLPKATWLEDENARVELEWLLRDCVVLMRGQIRSGEKLRVAVLSLLDRLVDEGSSMAFHLREMIVAPLAGNQAA